jgi:hypothetical protein
MSRDGLHSGSLDTVAGSGSHTTGAGVLNRLSEVVSSARTGSIPSDAHISECQFRYPGWVTRCSSAQNLETNLVTNEGFEFLNGPFPELELVLWSRGICAEVRIEYDLVQ